LRHIQAERISNMYEFGKSLGEGVTSKVKIASLKSNPKIKFAIKSIPRDYFNAIENCEFEDDQIYIQRSI